MWLAVLGVLFILCNATRLAAADTPKSGAAIVAPWQLSRTSDQARVYVDVSLSMKGFIGTPGQAHALLARELKRILVNADIVNFEVVEFADQRSRPRAVAHFEEFGQVLKYRGAETYLPDVIDDGGLWAANGVILVLTDGVVSVSRYRGPPVGSPSARGCAAGSDATCLALSVREYVGGGRGFWIVGVKLPFRGPHYVEEGGADPKSPRVIEGGTFPDRPFYVWIGAPSVAQGRALVRGLLDFAAARKLERLAVEVAPGDWERWQVDPSAREADVVAVSRVDKQFCPQGDLFRRFVPASGDGGVPTIEAEEPRRSWLPFLRQNTSPTLGFALPVMPVLPMGDLSKQVGTLARYSQEIATTDGATRVSSKVRPAAGRTILDLCLSYHGPLVAKRKGKTVDLAATWKQTLSRERVWEGWSTNTDDTREAVARTVNLDVFFIHLQRSLTSSDVSEMIKPAPFLRVKYP